MPVVQDGRLVGLLSRESIICYLAGAAKFEDG